MGVKKQKENCYDPVLWRTSVREGWGPVVTEAARHGTPSIVYDGAGLQDAVIQGVTGKIVSPNLKSLALGTQNLWEVRYEEFARNALRHSREFSWMRSTEALAELLAIGIATAR